MKAGFCIECNQNVYLDDANNCVNGHPAPCIRGVYETEPSDEHHEAHAGVADTVASAPGPTPRVGPAAAAVPPAVGATTLAEPELRTEGAAGGQQIQSDATQGWPLYILGGVALLAGAFLPWLWFHVDGLSVPISETGYEFGGHGFFTAALGAYLIILGVAGINRRFSKTVRRIAAVAALVAGCIAGATLLKPGQLALPGLRVKAGYGVYLSIAGGIVGLAGWVMDEAASAGVDPLTWLRSRLPSS